MKEDWSIVKGFPNYLVSSLGKVYSKHSKKYLRPVKMCFQYRVELYNSGIGQTFMISRLVLSHFNRLPTPVEIAGFLDYNRKNLDIDNLDWFTRSDWIRFLKTGKKRGAYRFPIGGTNIKWRAALKMNGQIKTLGYYRTKEEAHKVFYNTFINQYGYAPW